MDQLFPLMQPILMDRPPSQPNWIHQIKYDGIRILCMVHSASIELYTRNQKKRNVQYPEIEQISNHVKAKSFILDGEVIVRTEKQKPQFSRVVRRDRSSKTEKVKQMMKEFPLEYHVFDILMKDGEDLRKRPLTERLVTLHDIVRPTNWLYLVESQTDGLDLFAKMAELKWEGIVSKDLNSPYIGGKAHKHWHKTKVKKQLLCVVGGVQYKDGYPNSLLIGVYMEDQLRFVGKISTGLTGKDLQLLHVFVPQLEQPGSPFLNPPVQPLPIRWIKPQLTLLAEFMELTDDGLLRHPKILGFTQSPPEQARWES
ncbi:non-homologous end-joining DNA ligase [Paenibacillus harenae]|uniref:non-homologous end-joining DNA ligase n=1 Tax=Paenibacillus harenae TaxID=306543 RepID=UPI0004145FE6|nr:non-homologous end-joining DNA ligase [Paenibacillus harenae]